MRGCGAPQTWAGARLGRCGGERVGRCWAAYGHGPEEREFYSFPFLFLFLFQNINSIRISSILFNLTKSEKF